MGQLAIDEEIKKLLHLPGSSESLLEIVIPLMPYDLAEAIRQLDHEEQLMLVAMLPPEIAAEALEYLEPEIQYRILHHLDKENAIPLLSEMSSDVVVDLLLAIHPRQAEILKAWLPFEYQQKLDTLMTFPEHTAGSLVTVDYIAVREGWTVQKTLERIRRVGHEAELISYIYVVNARGQLVDVVSLREIILADPNAHLAEIVNKEVVSIPADLNREEAARILSQYDLVALPVVDAQNRLIGIITVDDLVDVIQDEATEDIHRLGGSQPLTESYFKTSVFELVRKRVGWLLILFLAEAYTGTVIRHFEDTLQQVVALAFFIPLLIGTGGNTGTQVVTTLVRGLAVGEINFRDMFRVMLRELSTGAILGIVMGGATVLRAYTLGVGLELGPIVGLTALFIVIWASLISSVLPLLLFRFRVDPAVVSGPFITTIVDGTGLFLYFTIARIMLGL